MTMDGGIGLFSTLFLILFAWGIYRRIQAIVGKRPYNPMKIQIRLVVLGVALGLLFLTHPLEKATILHGGLGGAAGALFVYIMSKGLRFTKEGDTLYYQINPFLSLFLTGLVLMRILMKLPIFLYLTAWLDAPHKPPLDLSYTSSMMDPASFFIMMMLFAYIVGSSSWIFFKGRTMFRK